MTWKTIVSPFGRPSPHSQPPRPCATPPPPNPRRRVLSPIATIVASLSSKSPFVVAFEDEDNAKLLEARRRLVRTVCGLQPAAPGAAADGGDAGPPVRWELPASDHLVLLAAFDEWQQRPYQERAEFCQEYGLSGPSLPPALSPSTARPVPQASGGRAPSRTGGPPAQGTAGGP